jgi:hypothetical protein
MSTSPFSMRVPVPVSTVAPRISVGVDGGIVYVEANGAGVGALVVAGVASGTDVFEGGGVAHAPINAHNRGIAKCLRGAGDAARSWLCCIRLVSFRRSDAIYQIVIHCACLVIEQPALAV